MLSVFQIAKRSMSKILRVPCANFPKTRPHSTPKRHIPSCHKLIHGDTALVQLTTQHKKLPGGSWKKSLFFHFRKNRQLRIPNSTANRIWIKAGLANNTMGKLSRTCTLHTCSPKPLGSEFFCFSHCSVPTGTSWTNSSKPTTSPLRLRYYLDEQRFHFITLLFMLSTLSVRTDLHLSNVFQKQNAFLCVCLDARRERDRKRSRKRNSRRFDARAKGSKRTIRSLHRVCGRGGATRSHECSSVRKLAWCTCHCMWLKAQKKTIHTGRCLQVVRWWSFSLLTNVTYCSLSSFHWCHL